MPNGLSERQRAVLFPYGVLTLLLAIIFWPAWVEGERLVVGGDTLLIHYPWWVLWRDLLSAGEPPFWNPYTFSGIPAFATLQAGYGYPLHWLLTPLPPVRAINWTVGLHIILAGLGTAWCAGRLGATPSGQLLSGASFALGSAMTARLWAGHLSFVETNAWLPLATGLALQVGQRGAVVKLALVVTMMVLAGQPEVLIFALWWLPAWAVGGAHRTPERRVFRAAIRVGVALGLGVALAAFQLLPVLEMLRYSNRQGGVSWEFRTGLSLPPWHLLTAIVPTLFGDPRQTYWPANTYEWHERVFFIGLIPLFAAGLARGGWRWLCWGLALVAILLSFGSYLPGYGLTGILPGYSTFRVPPKHLLLAALALALAAGIGLERLHGRRVARIALAGAGLTALAALSAAFWLPGLADALAAPQRLAAPAVQAGLVTTAATGLGWAAVTLAAIAGAALLPAVAARRTLAALAVVELVLILNPYYLRLSDLRSVLTDANHLLGHERAAVIGPSQPILANQGPVIRVVQPSGYISLFSMAYQQLVVGGTNASVSLGIASREDPAVTLLGIHAILEPAEGRLTVIEPVPPLVWVARCTWPGGPLEARAPDFPRSQCVTRPDARSAEPAVEPGQATTIASGPSWMTVQADGPGWLATRVPWYPGWGARLDGVPVPVELVNGALVGVRLPEGSHTVALRYVPAGLDVGLVVSGVAAFVIAVLWWADALLARRQRRLQTAPPAAS